jgi:hypothetical protein
LDIVEIPTVVLLCLFQGLVAGLLRPRPSLKQIMQSSSSGKFRERHNINSPKMFGYAQFSSPTAATCTISRDAGTMNMHENIEFSETFYVGIIFIFIQLLTKIKHQNCSFA